MTDSLADYADRFTGRRHPLGACRVVSGRRVAPASHDEPDDRIRILPGRRPRGRAREPASRYGTAAIRWRIAASAGVSPAVSTSPSGLRPVIEAYSTQAAR